MKKGTIWLSSLILCLALALFVPMQAQAAEVIASGTCGGEGDGTNLTWVLENDGVLTISGEGEMSSAPWTDYWNDIVAVVIEDGAESICSNAFANCGALESITIPVSLMTIAPGAFQSCDALATVIYGGIAEQWLVMDIGSGNDEFTNAEIVFVDGEPSVVDSGECGENLTWKLTANGTLTISGTGAMTDYQPGSNLAPWVAYSNYGDSEYNVVINGIVIESGVTRVGNYAFERCNLLKSIAIPEGVTSIGQGAFEHSCLTSVELPDSLVSIEGYAFWGCSLTSVEIPANVESIGDAAFGASNYLTDINVNSENKCYSSIDGVLFNKDQTALIRCPEGKTLTTYRVPDSVESIGNSAFYSCASLTSVEIPDSVVSIGDEAFYSCDELVNISLGSGVTSIGEGAFAYCSSLVEIVIPDTVMTIGDSIFSGCESLASVSLSKNVTEIGYYWFADCTSLTDLTFLDQVERIGYYSFRGCTGLTSVVIPDSVTEIGGNAFFDCTGITEVTISDRVRRIYGGVFSGCENLRKVNYSGSKAQWEYLFDSGYINNDDYWQNVEVTFGKEVVAFGPAGKELTWELDENGVLTIDGSGSMWESRPSWSSYRDAITSVVFSGEVTNIGMESFKDCINLTSITIPNSVTSIGANAFSGCTSLESITIPDSVTTIDVQAFSGCTSLKSITIPDSVTSLGDSAFYRCTSLAQVQLSKNLTTLSGTFSECTSLKSVVIPYGVTCIESAAFSGCTSLMSVEIPDSVTTINGGFRGCTALTAITIPGSVTRIGSWTFADCSGLTSITIPDSVTSIGEYAFGYCSAVTSVKIGSGVTELPGYVFYCCTALTSVDIPEGITAIGSSAFRECTALSRVSIPVSVTKIGEWAFYNCGALTNVQYDGTGEQWNAIEMDFDTSSVLSAYLNLGSEVAAPTVTIGLNENNKPVITWTKVDGAEKYELWCSVNGGAFKLLKTMTGTKITHTSAVSGSTYIYKVCAVAGETRSAFSEPSGLTVPAEVVIGVPTVTVNLNSSNQPVLTWGAVDGAEKYEVWRAVGNGEYSRLWTGTGRKLTNTSAEEGKTYSYKVRAVAGTTYSEYSAVKTITVPAEVVLEAPTLTAANKASTGKVVLSWNKIDGAEKYEIWFSTSKSGTYKKLWTGTGTTVNHNSATEGVTYYYKVRALAGGVYSEFSAIKLRACDLAQPVVTVSNNASTGKVVISWKAVSGAAKYEVYRSTSKNGTYTRLWTGTGTKLNHTSSEVGVTYYYKVRALHATNTSATSAYSVIKSRTCDCARPSVTITLNSSGKPVLSWGKVEGAVKYEVYRSTSENGTYSLLWSGTGTKLTNSSAKAGVTYYYKVKAICSVSSGNSAYSAVQSVTAK